MQFPIFEALKKNKTISHQILGVKPVHVPAVESHHELDVVDDRVRDVVQVDGRRHRLQHLF